MSPSRLRCVGPALVIAFALPAAARAGADQADFFETRIRPVLVQHCYKCHAAEAKKIKGGLRLDTRAGLRQGGDSGAAVVPGQPAKSLLLQALRYEGPKMPPSGRLPAAVIADFEKWIATGAFDPRGETRGAASVSLAAARRHWSYQPIRRPSLPPVRHGDWPAGPIDRLILAKLESRGLTPSAPADRRTLIRRAYYDLIGLPPTAAEVEAFAADAAPDAFAKVVDRLLASPHYGERWGRHWLDVARYADTKDLVLLFGNDRVRPYAYTYRDYVIQALNADTPYDRFVHEQLAADQLDLRGEKWRLAAMGFLTLGRLFCNNPHDIYDDQIDTVGRGLLGLTVACARCHDHKYDAIASADYYALYGVFASSETPLDLPLIADPKSIPGAAAFEQQLAKKRQALQRFVDDQYRLLSEAARTQTTDYLLRVATAKPDPLEGAVFFLSLSPTDLRPAIVARWRRYLQRRARPDDPVFGPWHDLMQLADEPFAIGAQSAVARWRSVPVGVGRGQINPLVQEALARTQLRSKADVARMYGALLVRVYQESRGVARSGDRATTLVAGSSPARQQLLGILTGNDSPAYFPKRNTPQYMSRVEKDSYGGKCLELDKLAVSSPSAPPRAMVLVDVAESYNPRVFRRGNPSQPGQSVPRRFLQILAGDSPPFTHGSGRIDLARAITAPDNPLTSRVIVNRVWMHHFGEPLVSTPSDFGVRSTPPTHPELLDYLAWTFQHEDGWSLKRLHRRILLSRTYQQASFDRPECRAADPDNRLLWRANRRRLDFEAMRDTLLSVSGRLDQTMGGRPVDVAGDPHNRRRTVYGKVDRQDLPGLFRAFDFAVPDQSVERRPQTTVPQQALFALNAPFVIEQARALAARPDVTAAPTPARRVAALYRAVLSRPPEPLDVELALRFLTSAESERQIPSLSAWEQFAQVLLLMNESQFID